MGDKIVRGLFVGGSLGVFSFLAGFTHSMFASLGFGMLAGFLAGITRFYLDKKK